MRTIIRWTMLVSVGCLGPLLIGLALSDEPTGTTAIRPTGVTRAADKTSAVREFGVSLETARDRAKLMHAIYSATLDSIHHHYFRKGLRILPARAMEDIFAEMAEQTRVEAKWIAVSFKAMGIDHEPEGDFELEAVGRLSAGKGEFERIQDGYYRRAAAIPLGGGCIGCHAGSSPRTSRSPSVAGLVIRVPLKTD